VSAVSETIVREYFELHGFFVRQRRKYISPARRDDDEVDFFVINPRPEATGALPFVLASADLAGVARAMVVVKGWHTETFSPGLLANAPEIFRFMKPAAFKRAARAFGNDDKLTTLLVVPALPTGAEARKRSIELLRAGGIDAVLPFRTLLADLIEQIAVNRNYQKSDLLQIIRILKNYGFFREPQMELFRPGRKRRGTNISPSEGDQEEG
jgi:hypothetical protein